MAVPHPNFTQSMYSQALSTASSKARSGIPLSITIVRPRVLGRSLRAGRLSAVGMAVMACPLVGCKWKRQSRVHQGQLGHLDQATARYLSCGSHGKIIRDEDLHRSLVSAQGGL